MSLLKTSTLNGMGMAVKLLFGLLVNKVVAVLAGPSGIAIYGQFQSLTLLMSGLAAAPGQAGVIRLTAAHQDDLPKAYGYWAAALRAVLLSSLVLVVLGVVLSPVLAEHILKRADLGTSLMLYWLMALPALPLMTLLLSCANGMAQIRSYVIAGMFSALIVSVMAIIGVQLNGIGGVVVAVGLGQMLSLLAVYAYFRGQPWFVQANFRRMVDASAIREIFTLATMTLVAVACAPMVQMAVRHLMTEQFGLTTVGYWQAVNRLGDMYVTVVTSLLAVYYLPRFSAIKQLPELRKEIRSFLLLVYPLFLLGYAVVVLLREWVITLVYSSEFLPAAALMPLQMLSDATRMLAWLTGYLVMARGSAKMFVLVELLGSALIISLSSLFMAQYGYQGALYASALTNLAYASVFTFYLVKSERI